MSTSLIVRDPRTVAGEPGAAFHYEFGSRRRELSGEGRLTCTNVYRDPLAGHLMSLPSFDLTSMDPAHWSAIGDWVSATDQPAPFYRAGDGTWARALAQRDAAASWRLTEASSAPLGEGRFVRWITYNAPLDADLPALTLAFGGVWQLELDARGGATLLRQRADARGLDAVAQFGWLGGGEWAPSSHWLWIYEAGAKLVVRNVETRAGLVWHDDAPALGADGRPHALRRGPWSLQGDGPTALVCCPQQFVPGTSSVALADEQSLGWPGEGSTQPVAARLHALASTAAAAPRVAVWDHQGEDWPLAPSAAFTPGKTALGWRVSWTSDGSDSAFVSGLDLVVPRTLGNDGNTGVDLLALEGVAAERLSLRREADRLEQTLSAELRTWRRPLASHIQPNLRLRYVVDGVTRFVGDCHQASWQTTADTQPVSGTLHLTASGLWQRFERLSWPGGLPFDGRPLMECVAEVLAAGALSPSDYSLAADPFVLPEAPAGEPPSLVFRSGVKLARILLALRDRFFGDRLTMFERASDGKFVVDYTRGLSVDARFYESSALAQAAREPAQVLLAGSYREELRQAGLANVVTVIGQGPDAQPLLARAVDYDSLRDRTAFNYVGEVWERTLVDPALASQSAVNLACRSLFAQVRWPTVLASWRSVRLDLWPGQVVELVGPNHGRLYRLRGLTLEQTATGDAADPAGRATYFAEVLR